MDPIVGINNIYKICKDCKNIDYVELCENKKDIASKFPDCTVLTDTLIFTQFENYFITNLSEFKIPQNTRYTISFVNISLVSKKDKVYHSNVLIYDKEQNRVERFEPNGIGQSLYDNNQVEEILFEKFNEINIIYTKSHYFLPVLGPQSYDSGLDEGFCAIWTILYVFLRIAFPDISLILLISDMIKWNKKVRNVQVLSSFFLKML